MYKLGLSLVQLVVVVAMGAASADGTSIDRAEGDNEATASALYEPASR
jgi:hypothetical protein